VANSRQEGAVAIRSYLDAYVVILGSLADADARARGRSNLTSSPRNAFFVYP
jgi:hypothetical protein